MRLLIKTFSLFCISVLSVSYIAVLMSYHIYYDELYKNVNTAINQTQMIIQENIEDRIYNSNNARETINSNKSYLELFKKNLIILTDSNAQYEIYVYGIDYEKGLLDIQVDCIFPTIFNTDKTFSVRKSNIVEVLNEF